MDMNRKNHVGNGLRWMEALAREQITANQTAPSKQTSEEPTKSTLDGSTP